MFTKEFEIRWSDVDANRHLANSAYLNFMSHTRMAYLMEVGMSQRELAKHNIGLVVFYEHIYYFKEIFPGKPVKVSLEIQGLSEDGMYFEFVHNFYDSNGRNVAHCEMLGGWIDLKKRTLIALTKELYTKLNELPKAEDFKILTKEDTRKFDKRPKHLTSI